MESRNTKKFSFLSSQLFSLFTRPLQKTHQSHFPAHKVSETFYYFLKFVTKKDWPILKERVERSQERERSILFLLWSLDLNFSQANLLFSHAELCLWFVIFFFLLFCHRYVGNTLGCEFFFFLALLLLIYGLRFFRGLV